MVRGVFRDFLLPRIEMGSSQFSLELTGEAEDKVSFKQGRLAGQDGLP